MSRTRTIKNLYEKKDKTFAFDGFWRDVVGSPETSGAWIVSGAEKNGKTWFSVMLADYVSGFENTLYVSAEEGLAADFKATLRRAKISTTNKSLKFLEYISIDDLTEKLKKQRSAKIIVLDNLTIYNDELKNGGLRKFLLAHPNKLFVFIAHEEKKEIITASAKLCRRLAKVIFRVEGLAVDVSGRCPGGRLLIDEEKAMLYHGSEVLS